MNLKSEQKKTKEFKYNKTAIYMQVHPSRPSHFTSQPLGQQGRDKALVLKSPLEARLGAPRHEATRSAPRKR